MEAAAGQLVDQPLRPPESRNPEAHHQQQWVASGATEILDVLGPHPAEIPAKLEAFAMLNAITMLFVQNELAGGSDTQRRNAAYLYHAVTTGDHPQLARLLEPPPPAAVPDDRYADIITRILVGILGR